MQDFRKPLRPDELNWLVVALLPPPAEGRRGPIVIRLRYDKVCPTTGGGAFGSLHISQIEQRPLTAKGESEMRTNVPIRPRRRSAQHRNEWELFSGVVLIYFHAFLIPCCFLLLSVRSFVLTFAHKGHLLKDLVLFFQ